MSKRIIIAGGGTGGHIFPAVAVANALREQQPDVELLFVGAKGKMEMEKVPQAGYRIEGLDIAGFNRSAWWKNLSLPFKLIKSFWQVRSIFSRFRPHAAFGVGGYSSFPVLRYAQSEGIPTFLHEANAFAGKSNQMLGRKATIIFVATAGMERFFPPDRVRISGNPVRRNLLEHSLTRTEALNRFGLQPDKVTLLVVGGSLGARSINEAVRQGIDRWLNAGHQLIWQTGKLYTAEATAASAGKTGVWTDAFINDMSAAYTAADLVISRAGAMSVTELCLAGKPVIFVPYPYAAEDHQTANAQALEKMDAACIVRDQDAAAKLMELALQLAADEPRRKQLAQNISRQGRADADRFIANEILKALDDQA